MELATNLDLEPKLLAHEQNRWMIERAAATELFFTNVISLEC